jgi:hypothetical protein
VLERGTAAAVAAEHTEPGSRSWHDCRSSEENLKRLEQLREIER